jgi:hypothetical protein
MGLDSASNLHGVLQIGPYLQRELGYLQTWSNLVRQVGLDSLSSVS